MKRFAATAAALSIFIAQEGVPCTTIFLSHSKESVVAKNLDWFTGHGLVFVNKRNVAKTSALIRGENPLGWTSKYLSLTFTQTGREFPWEGINEAGVSVNLMQLFGTKYPGPQSDQRPTVNVLQYIQYILDMSASTDEALQNTRALRVGGLAAFPLHFMICDSSAKCATIEFLKGDLVEHSGGNLPYLTLANDTYDVSRKYLENQLATVGPEAILNSMSISSTSRFAKGALLGQLYDPSSDPVLYAFEALRQVAQPFTQWNIVFKLATKEIFFKTPAHQKVKGVRLLAFNPSCKDSVKEANIQSQDTGDITPTFGDYVKGHNDALVNAMMGISPEVRTEVAQTPDLTKCME